MRNVDERLQNERRAALRDTEWGQDFGQGSLTDAVNLLAIRIAKLERELAKALEGPRRPD